MLPHLLFIVPLFLLHELLGSLVIDYTAGTLITVKAKLSHSKMSVGRGDHLCLS